MSVFSAHQDATTWPKEDRAVDLDFRVAAVQVGYWLGWTSIGVVLVGLAFDAGIRDRPVLVGATLAAAAANAATMAIPWQEWLPGRRGRALLDLWCAGLIAFVVTLVAGGGSSFSPLLFLAVPFVAVVQVGWRRGLWLAVSVATCAVATVLLPLSAGATAMRLGLLAAAVAVALLLARAVRHEAVARKNAEGRTELERTLARESNHRIKNDLQTVADLLLLARPDGADGTAFDETASRIRSIATVHRLLTETEDRVDGETLLRCLTEGAPVPVTVVADPVHLNAATAQKLGIVANELVTNAFRHGMPPIIVRLDAGPLARLQVDDCGVGAAPPEGFGLELVRRMVEQGLDGRFELGRLPGGGTRAEVVFPVTT